MAPILTRKIDVETYLVFSTIFSIFLLLNFLHVGIDIFLGYPVILLNCGVLLVLDRLAIHRDHAIVIGAIALTSLIASHFSPTPLTSILAQIAGICIMSIYYFSILTTSGLTVLKWMDLYARISFYLAIFALAEYVLRHVVHYGGDEQRLKAFFPEPSLFIYTTLPAIGYYINSWAMNRRYGIEALIFVLAYILADSSLGYIGLLLIGIFAFIRMTVWRILFGLIVACALLAGVFYASYNFRIRATETWLAISHMSVRNTNGSTFALLSNLYVTAVAARDHPILGVGIGGYHSVYDFYIHDLGEKELQNEPLGLNSDDANSLFLRVLAEFGPFGLMLLFSFIFVCARVRDDPYRKIRNALLPYMLVRMGRFGSYFSLELYFFVGLYLLNYLEYRHVAAAKKLFSGNSSSKAVLKIT